MNVFQFGKKKILQNTIDDLSMQLAELKDREGEDLKKREKEIEFLIHKLRAVDITLPNN